jgi:hypothetical protein
MTFWQAYWQILSPILQGAAAGIGIFGTGFLIGYFTPDHPWVMAVYVVAVVLGLPAIGAYKMIRRRDRR